MLQVGDRVSFKHPDWGTGEETTRVSTIVDVLSSQTVRLDVPRVIMNIKDLTKVLERSSPFGSII